MQALRKMKAGTNKVRVKEDQKVANVFNTELAAPRQASPPRRQSPGETQQKKSGKRVTVMDDNESILTYTSTKPMAGDFVTHSPPADPAKSTSSNEKTRTSSPQTKKAVQS
mgnify:CR=1 FL=1